MKGWIKGYVLINLSLLVVIIVLGMVLLNPKTLTVINESIGGPIYSVPDAKNKVALMINVDWGEEWLPGMLDTLEAENVKATFFLTGSWAEKNPLMASNIAKAGHEIASHGATTRVMMSNLNASDTRQNIQKAQDQIYAATGQLPKLFAPHSGDYSNTTQDIAAQMGLPMILWSIDTIDWKRDGQANILARVFKHPHDGALVLMHPTEDTAVVLGDIIKGFRERGYELDTVSALLAYQGD